MLVRKLYDCWARWLRLGTWLVLRGGLLILILILSLRVRVWKPLARLVWLSHVMMHLDKGRPDIGIHKWSEHSRRHSHLRRDRARRIHESYLHSAWKRHHLRLPWLLRIKLDVSAILLRLVLLLI